jgi:hypothetical protein
MDGINIDRLIEDLETDGSLEKNASAGDAESPMMKVAEDLFSGGRMFAKGFVAELKKVAAEGGMAPTSQANVNEDQSVFKSVAKKVQERHGAGPAGATIGETGGGGVTEKKISGDNPNTTYGAVQPPQAKTPNKAEATGNVSQ